MSSNLAVESLPFSYVRLERQWLKQILRIEKESFTLPWSEDSFAAELAFSRSLALGISSGNDLTCHFFGHVVLDELHILNLATAKRWRRRGLAKALLSYALGTAAAGGARFAFLEVRKSNMIAQEMYKQFGFSDVGIRENYYRDNGEDAVLLQRNLLSADINTLFENSRLS